MIREGQGASFEELNEHEEPGNVVVEEQPLNQTGLSFEDVTRKAHLPLPRKAYLLLVALVVENIAMWVVAVIFLRPYPSLLTSGALAYTFGLRHAMDADHIAAIDNVTRRLVQDKQRPVAVGLFFALGHSTVVFIACLVVVASVSAARERIEDFSEIGSLIGTGVSATFLLVVGFLNLASLWAINKAMRRLQENPDEMSVMEVPTPGGLLGRCLGGMFNLVDRSWKLYPLGFLFGLGFDTSTEISLLSISASESEGGAPVQLTMFLPLLFASGMTLVDSLDGIFMLGTYTYAAADAKKKLYYTFLFTLLSVVFAFVIGFVQLMNFISLALALESPFWAFFQNVSDSFGLFGVLVALLFVCVWIGAVYFERKVRPSDESGAVEERNQV